MSQQHDDITLLRGRAYFDAVFEAIDAAREQVLVETYIFKLDHTGSEFLEHMSRAARRGVRVRMITDGLGSPALTPADEHRMREAGVDLIIHQPPGLIRLRALHGRMHRKLVVVDRRKAFLGGLNIADEYADLEAPGAFYDLAVRISGPIAVEAATLSEALFAKVSSHPGRLAWRAFSRSNRASHARQAARVNRLVVKGTHTRRSDIEREYRQAIRSATRSILLAQAYFLPSRGFLKAICAAARRGVDTVVLLQGRAEHPVLRWAERRLYDRMLRAGVRIYEYQPFLLHAKLMTVDSRWSTIGSSNLEPWSLISNHELNLVSKDPSLAQAITSEIGPRMQAECIQIDSSRLGPMSRILGAIARGLVLGIFVLSGGRSDRMWRVTSNNSARGSRGMRSTD